MNGAGINCSFAIENDATGTCVDKTLGWAIAVGAPYAFPTTLSAEFSRRGVDWCGSFGCVTSA